jgi:hypothetical protein
MALSKHKHRSLDPGVAIVGAGPDEIASANDFAGVSPDVPSTIRLEIGSVTPQEQVLIPDAAGIFRATVVGVDVAGDSQVTEFLVINTGEGADGITVLHTAGAALTLALIISGTDLALVSTHTAAVNASVFFAPVSRPAVPTA